MSAHENCFVLKLISGASAQPSRVFRAGTPVPPFSVGTCGDWKISAPDVDGAHFYIAFDGQRVHVAAVSPQSNLFVLGEDIGITFVPLSAPCNLFFGGACIAIAAPEKHSDSESARGVRTSRTLPDLSRAGEVQTQLLDVSQAMLRTRRLEVSADLLASLREAPKHAPVGSETKPGYEVLPAHITTLSGKLDMACTLYDGGALRERALQLASGSPDGLLAPATAELISPAAESPSPAPPPPGTLHRASRVRQLALLLAPLAIGLGVWDLFSAGSPAAAAGTALRPKPAHSASASAVSSVAPASPTAPALALEARQDAGLQPAAAAPENDALARAALAAAFSGNRTEAAVLYERLATARKAPVFALAARLAREDRIRKP